MHHAGIKPVLQPMNINILKKTHECYQMPAYLVSVLSLELQVFSWYRFFSTSGTLS